jgi:hypothetical protein
MQPQGFKIWEVGNEKQIVHVDGFYLSRTWEPTMKLLPFVCASLLFSSSLYGESDYTSDFDGDGVPDRLTVNAISSPENPDDVVDYRVQIVFSTNAPPIDIVLSEDPDAFYIASCRQIANCIVIDRTRSFGWKYDRSYDLYTWDDKYKKMCLHASVYQTMYEPSEPEAASGMPKQSYVRAYNKCEEIGGNVPGPEITDQSYWNTYNVSAKIVMGKSWLYSSPDVKNKTKMYLIKDDQVTIKEHKYVRGTDWYLVEYMPSKKIKPVSKWIKGSDIGYQFSS